MGKCTGCGSNPGPPRDDNFFCGYYDGCKGYEAEKKAREYDEYDCKCDSCGRKSVHVDVTTYTDGSSVEVGFCHHCLDNWREEQEAFTK